MKKLSKPKKVIALSCLSALALGALGVTAAQSAITQSTPQEISMPAEEYSNAAPETINYFSEEVSRAAVTPDAKVTASMPTGESLLIKKIVNGNPEITEIKATDTCAADAAPDLNNVSTQVANGGKTVVFTSPDPLFSCLAGLTSPEDLDRRARIWAVRDNGTSWSLQKVDSAAAPLSSPSNYRYSNVTPAVSGDGREVVFVSDRKLDGPSPEEQGVFIKNLDSGNIQRLTLREQSGYSKGVMVYPTYRLSISASGRYVGWNTSSVPALYTSRMLSDEAGNSVKEVTMVDRDPDGNGIFTPSTYKIKGLPSPNPNFSMFQGNGRSGMLLGFNESNGEGKVIYKAVTKTGTSNTSAVTRSYVYNMTTGKLYQVSEKAFSEVSTDGHYAYSSISLETSVVHYDLGDNPGTSQVVVNTIAFPSVTWRAGGPGRNLMAVAKDRVISAELAPDNFLSLEIPVK